MVGAGLRVAKKYGTALFLDTSFFNAKRFRSAEILECPTGAISLGSSSPWGSLRLPNGRVVPYPRSVQVLNRLPLIQHPAVSPAALLAPKSPNRTLIGYFQSLRFLEGVEDDIVNWFSRPARKEWQLTSNSNGSRVPFVCIHVRRGDLSRGASNVEHIASLDYFASAISQLPREAGQSRLIIFTDSKESVKIDFESHKILRKYRFEFFEDSGMSSPEVLQAMSHASHFVMSSSTFGFWALWLAKKQRDGEILAFAPRGSRGFWHRFDADFVPIWV